MELKKNYLVAAMMTAALVGCGSDSDSNNGGSSVPSNVDCNTANTQCFVSGTLTQDFTMTSDIQWVLSGSVFVGEGQVEISTVTQKQSVKDAGITLTVEAGTDVRGLSNATLVITRGSKIMAEGTADSPITFSSFADDNYNGVGEWGGVIVQGFAPQYGAGNTGACYEGNAEEVCNVEGEGGLDETIRYGGNNADDNSGVIKYVRIAEGGRVSGPGNEVNGLTMQGVGYGTTVEYIQVHDNLDDGLEWFGGTVNVKYAVLTGNDDDSIDFDEGYQGNIQYAIVRMTPDRDAPAGSNDPRGIEANSSDDEYVPQTNAALANITIVGNKEYSGEPGMRLRGALTAALYNTAVFNFDECVRIDDAEINTAGDIELSNVTLHNVQGSEATCGEFYGHEESDTATGTNGLTAITLTDTAAVAGTVDQEDFAEVDNGSGFAFDNTTFIGAVDPSATDAWYTGWTLEGTMDDIAAQANTVPAAQ